jgi:hypothetical protein
MSILCGDADGVGVGEAAGICIPGMFSIPVCPAAGVGVGDLAGIFIPRISMPFMFMPRMSRFFGALCLRRALDLVFDLTFCFDLDFAFGFGIFMPGMSCISCP